MTWGAPWILSGGVLVLLPIVIHLLGRGRARRLPFPSLRFISTTRPLPTQRTRLHDLLLLVVRIGIVLAAVAALARPRFGEPATNGSTRDFIRAVIVDTSGSNAFTATGRPWMDEARTVAHRLADSATISATVWTSSPASMIAGATAWLSQHSGLGEIAIISRFPRGTFTPRDLTSLPAGIGVRLLPIADAPVPSRDTTHLAYGPRGVVASVNRRGDHGEIAWTSEPASVVTDAGVDLLAGPGDAFNVTVARAAASAVGVPRVRDTTRRVVIIYPGDPQRASLLASARPITDLWMLDVIARLRHNLGTSRLGHAATDSSKRIVLVRDDRGAEALSALSITMNGRDRLALFPAAPPDGALIVAAARALTPQVDAAARDTARLAPPELAALERRASARVAPSMTVDSPDGRWFWLAALVLLLIEWIIRRRAAPAQVTSGLHDVA